MAKEPNYDKVRKWLLKTGFDRNDLIEIIHEDIKRPNVVIPSQEELDELKNFLDATFSKKIRDLDIYLDDVTDKECLACFKESRETDLMDLNCKKLKTVDCPILDSYTWRRYPREFILKYPEFCHCLGHNTLLRR